MFDVYMTARRPSVEAGPLGPVDFAFYGRQGERIVISLSRKAAGKCLLQLAEVLGESPEPHPGQPRMDRPS